MPAFIDMTGQRFGMLVCEARGRSSRTYGVKWVCRCDCGNVVEVFGANLRRGLSTCCGCSHRKAYGHSYPRSPTYHSWDAMRARCEKPATNSYEIYGGRGITVCDRWKTFSNFLEDMGERPPGTTLDRIDPDGNYEPANCRWATNEEQHAPGRKKRGRKNVKAP